MPQYEFGRKIKKPVAYVLAGGASYGSVQVGQLRALADSDIRPNFVVGTSVGSLNGAVVAEDPETAPERLSELWATTTRDDVFGGVVSAALNLASGKPSAVGNDGLRALVERAVNARDFAELKIPHTAMATDFDTGVSVPLSEGDLISALLASAAIPAIFPSIYRDGIRLVDGGLVANVPIGQAVEQGARTIVVLDCGFTVLAPEGEDTFSGRLLRTAAIMAAQQVRRDMEKAEGLRVLYLPGPWPTNTMPDDFSKSEELADRAEQMSREWLADLEISGPGRYGSAPSDALAVHQVTLSHEARELAAEAGVIPVDEEKVAAQQAAREVEVAGGMAGEAAAKATAAAAAAGRAAMEAAKAVTGGGDEDRERGADSEAAASAAEAAVAAESAEEAAAAADEAADSAKSAGQKIIAKVLGKDEPKDEPKDDPQDN